MTRRLLCFSTAAGRSASTTWWTSSSAGRIRVDTQVPSAHVEAQQRPAEFHRAVRQGNGVIRAAQALPPVALHLAGGGRGRGPLVHRVHEASWWRRRTWWWPDAAQVTRGSVFCRQLRWRGRRRDAHLGVGHQGWVCSSTPYTGLLAVASRLRDVGSEASAGVGLNRCCRQRRSSGKSWSGLGRGGHGTVHDTYNIIGDNWRE